MSNKFSKRFFNYSRNLYPKVMMFHIFFICRYLWIHNLLICQSHQLFVKFYRMKHIKGLAIFAINKGLGRGIIQKLFTPKVKKKGVVQSRKNIPKQIKNQKQSIYYKIVKVSKRVQQLQQTLRNSRQVFNHLKISKLELTVLSQNIMKIVNALNALKNIILNEHQSKLNLEHISFVVTHFQQYFQQNQEAQSSEELAIKIVRFQYQFFYILQVLMTAVIPRQIVSISRFQNCEKLMKSTQISQMGGQRQMILSQEALSKITNIAAAAILQQQSHKNFLFKKIMFGMAFSKYMIFYNQALLRTMGFYRNPDVGIISKIWNSPQMGALKYLSTITFQYIMCNKMIWIPVSKSQSSQSILQEGSNKIPVRILSSKKIQVYQRRQMNTKSQTKKFKTVLIHIHGGGFLAMSSHSMQIFTRKWANQLQIPVICIDYRMPPGFPFPTPLQDCFRAYQFIVQQLYQYMNIEAENIILAGDSAGGNLSCSLIGMIIKKGLKIPKGLFLAYPSTDLTMNFSPSYMNAFKDPLMKPSLLLLCLKQYLAYDHKQGMNPLASPILLTESFVRGQRFPLDWPETIIYVGGRDPILDDSLKLALKLSQNDTPFHLKIYKYFSHGFFNLSFLIPECDQIIQQSCRDIKLKFLTEFKIK